MSSQPTQPSPPLHPGPDPLDPNPSGPNPNPPVPAVTAGLGALSAVALEHFGDGELDGGALADAAAIGETLQPL